MRLARTAPLLSGMALCACFTVHASEAPAPQSASKPSVEQTQASASNDVSVGIDAKTKKLRPLTAAETRALADKARTMPQRAGSQWAKAPKTAAQARATLRTRAGGAASMRVPTDAMSELTVSTDANGQLHFSEDGAAHATTQEVSE